MIPNVSNLLNIYTYINKTNINTSKNLILEPFCTLIKLILLSYKDKGTKISIYNNSIQYQEPSYIQGILRIWSGDCREDLHNLYNPIIKALEYCDLNNDKHIYLLNKCIDGINNLIQNYDNNSIITHTLNHYINIIKKYINNNELDDSLKKTTPLVEGLKIFWDEKELRLIYNMLVHIDENKNKNEKIVYLKNIEDIITFKEKEVYDYISVKSTTYD